MNPIDRAQFKPAARGFTLAELVVVLFSLTMFLALLVAGCHKAYMEAYPANTEQLINRLAAAIQAYYSDFNAYPGIFKNDDLGTANMPAITNIGNPKNITETENMELSLCGGLIWKGKTLTYDDPTLRAAKGAVEMNDPATTKQFPCYLVPGANDFLTTDVTGNLATTKFWNPTANAAGAQDSEIPEFSDGASDRPMPIVYLRAKIGMAIACDGPAPGTASKAEYNYGHLAPYFGNAVPSVGRGGWTNYFGDPGVPLISGQPQPRNKDGFWLISAGADRAYGTSDDICYGFQF